MNSLCALPSKTALHRLSLQATRSLVKPHVGFEAFVEPLAKLFEQYADEMGKAGVDVQKMRASLKTYQDLAATRAELAEQLAIVDNTRFVASCAAWKQMLLIYGRARQAARVNANIAGAIDAFERFMKTGPRKSMATTAPAPMGPVTG